MSTFASALSASALFSGLGRDTCQEIAAYVHRRSFGGGQIIVLAGEPTRSVFWVAKGQVRVQHMSPQGREYALHTLGPGECFNLASTLDGGRNLATVSALTPTVVHAISSDLFRDLLQRHPELLSAALAHLTDRVRRLSDAVEDLALHSVRTRLARCLLSQADRGPSFSFGLTQHEIAVQIGTVRDVVGRALRTFSREGLIRREGGRVVVIDPAGLQREALYVPG
jgi:CRP/FNR family transcriptional regulator